MDNTRTMTQRCWPAMLSLLFLGCATDGATPNRERLVIERPRPGGAASDMEAKRVDRSDIVMLSSRAGAQDPAALLGVKPMTYDELLRCAATLVELDAEARRSAESLRELDTRRVVLEREGKGIEEDRPSVDRKSTKEVNVYNDRIKGYQDALRGFNTSVQEYNAGQRARVVKTNGFNTDCAERAYRRSDRERLPRTLSAALEKRSGTLDLPVDDTAIRRGQVAR